MFVTLSFDGVFFFGVIMKEPNFSPVFASLYVGLCDIARKNGYALAVHGTMNLDFDLVAIPWTDEAVEPFDLIKKLEYLLNMFDGSIHYGLHAEEPEIKPHGRKAWLLIMGNGAAFDISVMPKLG